MQKGMQQAVELNQQQAITAAEAKLGRSLTSDERAGIQRISSLMMLESVCRAFSFPGYTAEEVLADLEHFSKPPHERGMKFGANRIRKSTAVQSSEARLLGAILIVVAGLFLPATLYTGLHALVWVELFILILGAWVFYINWREHPLKKLKVLAFGFVILIVGVLVGQHFDRPKLTGTWVADLDHGARSTITFSLDGSYEAQITGRYTNGVIVRIAGTQRVTADGFLVDTMTKNSNTNAVLPIVSRARIIRFNDRELVRLEDGETNEITLRRESR